MNDYYVYEWIRLDTNEPFYVGKGRSNRPYRLDRNQHTQNIMRKHGAAVVILHDNLTNDEACQIECWYIHEYKYLGPYELTNGTDGGDGVAGWKDSEETVKKKSESNWLKDRGHLVCGINNPNSKPIIVKRPNSEIEEEYTNTTELAVIIDPENPSKAFRALRKLSNGWIPKSKKNPWYGWKVLDI